MEASASESNANEKLLDIWNNGIANKSSYLTGEIKAKVLDVVNDYKRIIDIFKPIFFRISI